MWVISTHPNCVWKTMIYIYIYTHQFIYQQQSFIVYFNHPFIYLCSILSSNVDLVARVLSPVEEPRPQAGLIGPGLVRPSRTADRSKTLWEVWRVCSSKWPSDNGWYMDNLWIIYGSSMDNLWIWLVVSTYPSEKWWSSSIGMMNFPIYGKIVQSCSSHHQPVFKMAISSGLETFTRWR